MTHGHVCAVCARTYRCSCLVADHPPEPPWNRLNGRPMLTWRPLCRRCGEAEDRLKTMRA